MRTPGGSSARQHPSLRAMLPRASSVHRWAPEHYMRNGKSRVAPRSLSPRPTSDANPNRRKTGLNRRSAASPRPRKHMHCPPRHARHGRYILGQPWNRRDGAHRNDAHLAQNQAALLTKFNSRARMSRQLPISTAIARQVVHANAHDEPPQTCNRPRRWGATTSSSTRRSTSFFGSHTQHPTDAKLAAHLCMRRPRAAAG